jgi:anti-anti-sigma factor
VGDMARIEVQQQPEDRCLIRIHGEVDMSNTDEVWTAMVEAMTDNVSAVTVDLSPTRYMDSAGLRLLFQLAALLAARRRDLILVVPEDAPIRHALELTGLSDVVRILSVGED